MLNIFTKLVFLICILSFTTRFCDARKVPGYIITVNSDTIYGMIKVSDFNRTTGNWVFNGIDLEPFHFEVFFKENEKSNYQIFNSDNILGFGFKYKSTDYIFQRFLIASKSILKNERSRHRFLLLEFYGKVCLYKDLIRVNHNISSMNKCDSYVYYNYYLYNEFLGLKKVELTNEIKSLVDLLHMYGFEQDFLDMIPPKANLKDIKTILKEYNIWQTAKITMKWVDQMKNPLQSINNQQIGLLDFNFTLENQL